MDWSIVILVVAVAAVAYFVWNQRKGTGDSGAAMPAAGAAGTAGVATPPRSTAGATAAAPLASYDEYRRVNPSHMVYNKLTCNRCGSNMIKTSGGTALCGNCGAALYRA